MCLPCLLQPGDTLKLWINDQRVSGRVGQDRTILSGYSIWWESEVVPSSNGGLVTQDREWVGSWTQWDVVLVEELHEVVIDNHISELLVEWSHVRDES